MDQLIPSLDHRLAPLAVAFRKEVFDLFRRMIAAWIVCLGRRTISRVWETAGQAELRHHAAYHDVVRRPKTSPARLASGYQDHTGNL
jgi:hypothetical protein